MKERVTRMREHHPVRRALAGERSGRGLCFGQLAGRRWSSGVFLLLLVITSLCPHPQVEKEFVVETRATGAVSAAFRASSYCGAGQSS